MKVIDCIFMVKEEIEEYIDVVQKVWTARFPHPPVESFCAKTHKLRADKKNGHFGPKIRAIFFTEIAHFFAILDAVLVPNN